MNGLTSIQSRFSVAETVSRLLAAATAKGLSIFARIDHAAGAAAAGLALRPMELLIFGNPRAGTPLLQAQPTSGIDLPLKALAWEDPEGKVWLTFNEPDWIALRHGLGPETSATVETLRRGLVAIAGAAVA